MAETTQLTQDATVGVYAEVCNIATLEAAYDAAYEHIDYPPDNAEEWIINLHNHLVWRSYTPGEDPTADTIILEAIASTLKRYAIQPNDAGTEIEKIINTLTLA